MRLFCRFFQSDFFFSFNDGGGGGGRPLAVVLMEATKDPLVRHLTLFDLVVIGVAGTIGSGIFAIVGLIGSSCEILAFHTLGFWSLVCISRDQYKKVSLTSESSPRELGVT